MKEPWNIFAKKDGSYNEGDYLPHFQILEQPDSALACAPAAMPAFRGDKPLTLREKFLRAAGKNPRAEEIFTRIRLFQDSIWTPQSMHAAEYENGGFHSYLARAIAGHDMKAATVELDVNFEIKPPPSELRDPGRNFPTVRQNWMLNGIEIPASARVPVYIIAPAKQMKTAVDMLRVFAGQTEEEVTHRGMHFNGAASVQAFGAGKEKHIANIMEGYGVIAGWFEIKQGVFITIDRDMFERAKRAFSATDMKNPPAVAAASPKA